MEHMKQQSKTTHVCDAHHQMLLFLFFGRSHRPCLSSLKRVSGSGWANEAATGKLSRLVDWRHLKTFKTSLLAYKIPVGRQLMSLLVSFLLKITSNTRPRMYSLEVDVFFLFKKCKVSKNHTISINLGTCGKRTSQTQYIPWGVANAGLSRLLTPAEVWGKAWHGRTIQAVNPGRTKRLGAGTESGVSSHLGTLSDPKSSQGKKLFTLNVEEYNSLDDVLACGLSVARAPETRACPAKLEACPDAKQKTGTNFNKWIWIMTHTHTPSRD